MRHAARLRRGAIALAAVVASILIASAISTRVLGARAEQRFPPGGAFVRVEGRDLHYARAGRGPSVVLLHGAFGGLQDFQATLWDDLARRADVIAFDRPGSGYSERARDRVVDPAEQARTLRAAAQALGVERPLLVGCSYGAAVALAWALQAPGEVAGVVTVGGAIEPWPGDTELAFRLAGVPVVGALFAHTLAAPLGTWLAERDVAQAFAPAPVPASFAASPVALGLRPASFLAQAEDLRVLNAFLADQAPRYGNLDVCVVLLHGTGDRVADAEVHSATAARALPRSTYRPIEGAGHQLLHSHPQRVLAAIDDLLARPTEVCRPPSEGD